MALLVGVLLGCVALLPPGPARAQTVAKTYRIGWLGHATQPAAEAGAGDFQKGLRDLGYIEGRNVSVEFRYAGGDVGKLPELASELIRSNVDILVTSGEPAAFAAKRLTSTIPIVATEFGLDPVKSGLVASLGHPGGNVTGLSTISEELWQKRLALLRQMVPKLARTTVIWNPANPGNVSCVDEIQAAGRALGIQSVFIEVGDARALERAFATIGRQAPDAIVTCWDSVTLEFAHQIAEFALKRRLPMLGPFKEYVQAGGLVSFGTSLRAHRRRAAYYVDRILKGAAPSDLAIEQPTLFELAINLTTAKALGITVPTMLLVLADDLVQ